MHKSVLLIADSCIPETNSAAKHIEDLRSTLNFKGVRTKQIAFKKQKKLFEIGYSDGTRYIYLKKFSPKNHLIRAMYELSYPVQLLLAYFFQRDFFKDLDGIIWYSPSIFFGPFIQFMKHRLKVRTYCVLRDLFPDWSVDLKIINSKILIKLLTIIQESQFKSADIIGIQTPKNLSYFNNKFQDKYNSEVLWSWGSEMRPYKRTALDNNKIRFIYLGNMSEAQDPINILKMFKLLNLSEQIEISFIGRGSEIRSLKKFSLSMPKNISISFHPPVKQSSIRDLLEGFNFGLIALSLEHKTHNVPGKLLTYLENYKRVIAILNPNNDLVSIINNNQVGIAITDLSEESIKYIKTKILSLPEESPEDRIRYVYNKYFNLNTNIEQILDSMFKGSQDG